MLSVERKAEIVLNDKNHDYARFSASSDYCNSQISMRDLEDGEINQAEITWRKMRGKDQDQPGRLL
jgi:hypothetical protein